MIEQYFLDFQKYFVVSICAGNTPLGKVFLERFRLQGDDMSNTR